jgi:hypothetical protein
VHVSDLLRTGPAEASLANLKAHVPENHLLGLGDNFALLLSSHSLEGATAPMKVTVGADFPGREIV